MLRIPQCCWVLMACDFLFAFSTRRYTTPSQSLRHSSLLSLFPITRLRSAQFYSTGSLRSFCGAVFAAPTASLWRRIDAGRMRHRCCRLQYETFEKQKSLLSNYCFCSSSHYRSTTSTKYSSINSFSHSWDSLATKIACGICAGPT